MKILIAIIIFSAIILFHEFGHFLFAKLNGISVTEFSLGMGPRLWSFQKGETRYSLKLLPLGGSCAMVGEDTAEEEIPGSFNAASVWGRISVVAAGPIFNFILGFIIAFIMVNLIVIRDPVATEIVDGGAAQEAGLEAGDMIRLNCWKWIKIQQLQRQGFRMETLLQNMTDIMWILQKICMYICI